MSALRPGDVFLGEAGRLGVITGRGGGYAYWSGTHWHRGLVYTGTTVDSFDPRLDDLTGCRYLGHRDDIALPALRLPGAP